MHFGQSIMEASPGASQIKKPMKIGIIGTGNMGKALGAGWARAGHDLLFGSRDPVKVKEAAGALGKNGDFDQAAAFGDVVLYTVRDVLPSKLLRSPQSLDGKIVIDCTNNAIFGMEKPDPKGRPGIHFELAKPSRAEQMAADIPKARIVKAFNCVASSLIESGVEKLRANAAQIFISADDKEAKAVVSRLAVDLGFTGIDSGGLDNATVVEGAADFVRLQIIAMGLGPMAALSIKTLV